MIRYLAIGIAVLLAACDPIVSTPASESPPSPSVSSTGEKPGGEKPANGLLVAIRTSHSGNHDRLEFEFGGDHPPKYRFEYVAEVHHDPSDRLIPLQGKAFIQLAFDGATLDTSPRESDMSKAQHYTGPTRITPDLPILKEVTVAGDFEGVLNFGIGLSAKSKLTFQTLDSPARVVIEISGL